VLPWRPDDCNSSPCLTLSRIVSGRCRPDVRMDTTVFPYLCMRRKSVYLSNTDWRLDGIATSSGGIHFEHLILLKLRRVSRRVAETSGRMQAWTVNTDRSPDACMGRPDGSWDPISLTWNLHRIFFELWEVHFWNEDSEINGIPDYVAILHKSDFIKHNVANHKLTVAIDQCE
jgi:hypothetical protein